MRNVRSGSFLRGHGGHRKSKQALLFASIGFISVLASGGAFAQTAANSAPTSTSTSAAATATSPAGTSIPSATQIVDASGAVWTIGAGKVMRNGAAAGFSANVVQLYFDGSTVFQQNRAGGWWSWNGSTWADATNPVAMTVSAAGTSIPSATQIVDASQAVWAVSGGKVMRNGAPAGFSANVVQLFFNGSTVFQQNSAGGWWLWNGSTWVDASNPTASTSTVTGSTTSTTASTGLAASTGTTSAPAPLVTSAAGTSIPSATKIVDASQAVWTINAGKVMRNGAPAGFSASVVKLYFNGSTVFQQNSAGGWWSWTGSTWADASNPTASTSAATGSTGSTGTTASTGTSSAPAALATSAAGTSIPSASQIVDASQAVWTISAGKVMRNGAPAGFNANVVQLYFNGSAVFQTNSAGGWWSWNGSTWVDASNPTAASTATASTATTTASTGTSTGSTSTTSSSSGATASTPPTATSSLPSTGARAVATFESLGLYWTPPSDPGSAGCEIVYKKTGDATWKKGFSMWYDSRNSECRGSLVQLTPGTSYEVQFAMPGQSPVAGLVATTWSEQFPVAKTVFLPNGTSSQPIDITDGGSPSGYVVYTFPPGGQSTIDVGNNSAHNISISAPYVIIRGLTLQGAQADAIAITDGAHDIVIEDNDISGWGRFNYTNSSGWQIGVDYDSGVHARCTEPSDTSAPSICATPMDRIVVQRNKIHDPRYGANSWSWGHPAGPQGISFSFIGGNHVIRYNEIYSTGGVQHYFDDAIGGEEQVSFAGFPNYDSDIYGNKVSQAWDDAIEAEGAGRNVRVWNNYIDQAAVGIATATISVGPIYVFRNVQNRSRQMSERALDDDDRNNFSKSGRPDQPSGGRRFLFHNTTLQASDSSATYPLGVGSGISTPDVNTVSRNNIFHIWKSWWSSISTSGGSNDDFDYDLFNGNINAYAGAEPNGIVGTPIYASGNGWQSESGGMYQLAPNSPGYDKGVLLPNFNDGYTGAAPDMGAHEAGTPAMKFGVSGGTKEY